MDWTNIEIVPGLADVIWAAYCLGYEESEGNVFMYDEKEATEFLVTLRNKWADTEENEAGQNFVEKATEEARKKFPMKSKKG